MVLFSRRALLKWSFLSFGTVAITQIPLALTAPQVNQISTLTFNADDFGFLNFVLLFEEIELAFYAAVVKSGKISGQQLEYIQAFAAHEAKHVEFLRNLLGSKVIFKSRDLSFNQAGLAAILTDRQKILNTVCTFTDLGVHAYNGAGLSLTNPTFLLAVASMVSVEARHAAGIREVLKRPATEPDSDAAVKSATIVNSLNPFQGRAYDELYSPRQIVGIVKSLNILKNPINGKLVA